MKTFRIEIMHIMRIATILTTIVAMMFVLAGNASAIVVGPLGNPTVVQAPIGMAVNPLGVRPPIVSTIVRPPIVNPLLRPPIFNPFFRPAIFNPFFRPIFNPFLGVDLDDLGLGLGVGAVGVGVGD